MRTLFIDFDGTICNDRFWRNLPEKENSLVQKKLFIENGELVADWMRGKYTSEEINEFVSKETRLPYDRIWNVFVDDCKKMHVDPEILELLTKLRKKFHLVLITGNMDCFDRFTAPNLELEKYFDTVVNSYTEGCLKTDNDGETFRKYLKGNIQDALLVEDSPTSCQTFSNLGGTALQVARTDKTIKHLQHILEEKF